MVYIPQVTKSKTLLKLLSMQAYLDFLTCILNIAKEHFYGCATRLICLACDNHHRSMYR